MPEVFIPRIREGQSVEVTFDALGDRTFAATVTEVGVASTGLATTFPVTARMNRDEPDVLPGMAAEVHFRFEGQGESERLVVPAFAVVREAAWRSVGLRPYDVQLMGGIVLHEGKIAEMKTGEGKTLVATMPVYLRALEGKGVHVVTVNDYLASRDAEWMGKIYGFLGMSTGVIISQQPDSDKKHAYRCDITYGQNNEFGFDYLRDNM